MYSWSSELKHILKSPNRDISPRPLTIFDFVDENKHLFADNELNGELELRLAKTSDIPLAVMEVRSLS